MSKHKFNTRQQGFGLLDVLIAVLVLAVGILSLGGLHSMIIKSSSASKARSAAAIIAQEKLDDLVSYQQLLAGGNGTFGFTEIANNAGGSENADGTLKLPSGNITVGNTSYARTWTVQDYYFCSNNAAPSTTNSCSAINPNFKLITMSVSWVDTDGTARAVSLQSTVAAISPSSTGQSATSGDRQGPTVTYTPGVAPEVIPIGLGDDTVKEATKPTPDISNHGISTITTFDEITYNNVLNTKRRDNFFTLNCVCEQEGVPGTNDPKGYLPTTFDGEQYVIPTSSTSSKRTGSTNRQGQNGVQPALCDICCRDHHDASTPSSSTPSSFDQAYDPFRPLSDYHSSGDHKHYYPDSSGNLVEANDSGDLYVEACRMVLVGGSPWVLQDWKLETHQIMPSSYLASNVSTYTTYITTFIEEFLSSSGASSTSTTYPLTTPNMSANSAVVSALASLPTTATMTVANTSQYVGRGLYIDYMSPELRKSIRCKIDPSLESGCPNSTAENYLPFVPFHEVNLTQLGNWTPTSDTIAKVTSDAIVDNLAYSRGLVTAVGPGTKNVNSSIGKSNTGLTGSNILDNDDGNFLVDTVAVTVSSSSSSSSSGSTTSSGSTSSSSSGSTSSSGGTTITISGTISNSGTSVGGNDLTISGTTCNFTSSGNAMPKSYSCTFTTTSGTIEIKGYSKTASSPSKPGYNNCLSPYSLASGLPSGSTISVSGTGSDEITTYALSGLTTSLTLNFTIKVDSNSNSGSCP